MSIDSNRVIVHLHNGISVMAEKVLHYVEPTTGCEMCFVITEDSIIHRIEFVNYWREIPLVIG